MIICIAFSNELLCLVPKSIFYLHVYVGVFKLMGFHQRLYRGGRKPKDSGCVCVIFYKVSHRFVARFHVSPRSTTSQPAMMHLDNECRFRVVCTTRLSNLHMWLSSIITHIILVNILQSAGTLPKIACGSDCLFGGSGDRNPKKPKKPMVFSPLLRLCVGKPRTERTPNPRSGQLHPL